MDACPVYPYAFIQVPAVARQVGVSIICRDLLGIPQEEWPQTVQALIERNHPAMILITLRNIDSAVSSDYKQAGAKTYFPVERTRELIDAIRAISELPIVLGGFGFSLLPEELMDYLRPDLGVVGGSDAFFARFDEVRAGNLDGLANLLYYQDERIVSNPRVFYPPLPVAEYTPQAIAEMMAFYDTFSSPGFEGAPVEVVRGCCHACVFCSEPHAVGKQVRYRDLSAVIADIELLVDHGVTQLYMISSELNPQGNEFVLHLADSIRSFNERQPDHRKVTWFGANYLLNFSADEHERLSRSGFTGGWFDMTALDDDNARAMRTPYRNASLIPCLEAYAHFERMRINEVQASTAAQPAGPGSEENARDRGIGWSLFLGNTATTTETIRNTLQVANQAGLAQRFDRCGITTSTRVFDYEEPDKATLATTYSVTPDLKRTSYRQLLPSFAYPPALLQAFGSEEQIESMFHHIKETYLSTAYQRSRDWHRFLIDTTTAAAIANWMVALPDMARVEAPGNFPTVIEGEPSPELQRLFANDLRDKERHTRQALAEQVVSALQAACMSACPEPFRELGLPATMDELEQATAYKVAVAVLGSWRTDRAFFGEVARLTGSSPCRSLQDLVRFCIRAMLYRFNVQFKPGYGALFRQGVAAAGRQDSAAHTGSNRVWTHRRSRE
jgi:hypothetical protein